MKKALRFIGLLLVILVAGVLILGLVAPKEFGVERSVVIDAPKAVVAAQMLHYKNFKNWSPWQDLDPNMRSEVVGPELTAGSKYTWKGNDDVGSGEMTIKTATENEIQYLMLFKEPWESKADGYWRVEDAGEGKTKAIWGFSSDASYPWNGLMMVMNMEKMLAKDFDKGLNKLKAVAEQDAQAVPTSNDMIAE